MSPDGRLVIAASADGTVRVWELASGKHLQTLPGHFHPVFGMAVSPDGKLVIAAGADGTVRVWELASGKQLQTLSGHSGPVDGVAVSPDGELAVSAGNDQTVRVWTLSDGREFARWVGDRPVTACEIAPNSALTIVVGDQSGAVYVLQLRGRVR